MNIEPNQRFGTRECPSCATEIPANHNRCPICGYHFPTPTPAQRGMRIFGALLMLGLLLIALLMGLF